MLENILHCVMDEISQEFEELKIRAEVNTRFSVQ